MTEHFFRNDISLSGGLQKFRAVFFARRETYLTRVWRFAFAEMDGQI